MERELFTAVGMLFIGAALVLGGRDGHFPSLALGIYCMLFGYGLLALDFVVRYSHLQ